MYYYRVKPEFDQKRRRDGSILVANELYTEKEVKRYSISPERLVSVTIPKSKVYFCFGARFEMKK